MKTIISCLLATGALLLALSPARALERYDIDPVHSSVGFKIKHLFSYVNGRFDEVHGTVTGDQTKPEETAVKVEIKTASVDTHDQKRDDHLRSNAFFDAEQFPTITFASKKVNLTGQDSAFVTGDLTMHGVTKEIIMEMKFLGKGKGPEGRMHTGWEGKSALKRSDFGLTWTKAVEGTQLVGDDVEISLEIDAVEPAPETVAVEPVNAPKAEGAPPAGLPPVAEPPPAVPPTLSPPPPAAEVPPLPPGSPLPTPANPAPSALPPATPPPAPPVPAAPEPPTPPAPPVPPAPPSPPVAPPPPSPNV